jgi:hypothetical protein
MHGFTYSGINFPSLMHMQEWAYVQLLFEKESELSATPGKTSYFKVMHW